MQWFSGIAGGLAAVAAIATLFVIVWYSRGLEKLTTRTNTHLEKMADIAERQAAFATVQDGRANLSRLSAVQSALQEVQMGCHRVSGPGISIPRPQEIRILEHAAWVLTQVEPSLDPDPDLRKDLVKLRSDCAGLAEIGRRKERGEEMIGAQDGPWNDLSDVLERLPAALNQRIEAYWTQVAKGLARLAQRYPPGQAGDS